jgi:hypothetical protein
MPILKWRIITWIAVLVCRSETQYHMIQTILLSFRMTDFAANITAFYPVWDGKTSMPAARRFSGINPTLSFTELHPASNPRSDIFLANRNGASGKRSLHSVPYVAYASLSRASLQSFTSATSHPRATAGKVRSLERKASNARSSSTSG